MIFLCLINSLFLLNILLLKLSYDFMESMVFFVVYSNYNEYTTFWRMEREKTMMRCLSSPKEQGGYAHCLWFIYRGRVLTSPWHESFAVVIFIVVLLAAESRVSNF